MFRRVLFAGVVLAALVLLAVGARSLPKQSGRMPKVHTDESMPPTLARPRVPRQAGVALGLFAEDVSFSYAPLLGEIADLGASHVALIVPLYQTHGASTQLYLHTRLSPTLEAVADAIREARRLGLEVTVFPIVRLLAPRSPQEWRGTLAPENRDAWFQSYAIHLGDLASLAQLTGASRLVVGSELSTLDSDLPRWKHLLERIRSAFSGTLVYSANWDHYADARIFEQVDELGVTAYFNLRDIKDPVQVDRMTERWREIGKTIETSLAHYNKPLIFTEVGYRSRRGATAEPWNEGSGGTADPSEQVKGFESFRRAWTLPGSNGPRLDGIYIWNYYGYGGPQSTSYTPRGKPALDIVRRILEDLKGR